MTRPGYRFPAFMREQRIAHHWTLAEAGRACSHSATWYRNCEEGNIIEPRLETQREIARGLGVPLSDVRAALGLPPLDDPEGDALLAALDEVAAVLRETAPARYPFIVEAVRLVARVPDNHT